jgi:preprotein translocase subunit SecE
MNVVTYLQETVAELKLVRWPTRQQTINLTLIVIGISVLVGMYVGGLDFMFTNLLKFITNTK